MLVADDSAVMRRVITDLFRSEKDIEVVALARNGYEVLEEVRSKSVDVVLLDLVMPEMDGVETALRINQEMSTPVILFTGAREEEVERALSSIADGVFDVVLKPDGHLSLDLDHVRERLLSTVRSAAERKWRPEPSPTCNHTDVNAGAQTSIPINRVDSKAKVVIIGASTGGPPAVESVLKQLPGPLPVPVVVAIHMPREFTGPYATRLARRTGHPVRHGAPPGPLERGWVYVCRGGLYSWIGVSGGRIYLYEGVSHPPRFSVDSRYRPSVDLLLLSSARSLTADVIAVVLSGMGKDGAIGAKSVLGAGGGVIVQDSTTSVVDGMPAAVRRSCPGAITSPLPKVAETLWTLLGGGRDGG